LFLHAFLGCDTTSRIHGIGKGLALNKFVKEKSFQEHAHAFGCQDKTRREVIAAGEKAFLSLYNSGNEDVTLNSLRYTLFCKKVSIGLSVLQPESLPPTSAAAAFHSMRAYFQVQQLIKGNDSLLPLEWGWELVDDKLLPIKTDRPAAPKALMEIIRCNCKANCSTNRCTCKKIQLRLYCGMWHLSGTELFKLSQARHGVSILI
jgi:hypothetical protein